MELLPVVFLSLHLPFVWGKSFVGERSVKYNISYSPAPKKTKEEVCNRQFVEITVSSVITKKSIRNLELTWDVQKLVKGDWIGLYLEDPIKKPASPVFTVTPTTNSGWKATPFEEKRIKYDNMYQPHCLGFWAVYWRVREVIAKSCLQTNPTWMKDNKHLIGKLKLKDLFWPGTHNSGSYLTIEKPSEENIVLRYVYTQDETILNQLIHGVRYLDLRVGYSSGNWWIHHDFIKLRPLQDVINDIKRFLDNTKEIVILDFHRFLYDFDIKSSRHNDFLEYLKSQFSNHLATPALSWSASLEDVWASKKRLIISYNNKELVERNQYNIWEAVSQKWANKRDLGNLRDYFENVIKSKPTYVWAAMAQFTPEFLNDIVLNKLGGLRKAANSNNRYITQWFRGPWSRQSNIVAMDFVRGSDIVNTAIECNIIKQNKHC